MYITNKLLRRYRRVGGGGLRRNLVSVRPNAAHNNNVNTRGRRSRRRSHRVTRVFFNRIFFLRNFLFSNSKRVSTLFSSNYRQGRIGRTVRENRRDRRPSNVTRIHVGWFYRATAGPASARPFLSANLTRAYDTNETRLHGVNVRDERLSSPPFETRPKRPPGTRTRMWTREYSRRLEGHESNTIAYPAKAFSMRARDGLL